jgi:primary-amine oxidase
MHEIDDGIGWKHTNSRTGAVSIVRSRVLVLQSIITVGNYEYIFMWHFDQAAGLHYKIQATAILSTAPIVAGTAVPWGTNANEGVMAHSISTLSACVLAILVMTCFINSLSNYSRDTLKYFNT